MEEKKTRRGIIVLLSVVFGSLLLFMLLSIGSNDENQSISKERMDSIQSMPMDDIIVYPRIVPYLPKQ